MNLSDSSNRGWRVIMPDGEIRTNLTYVEAHVIMGECDSENCRLIPPGEFNQ